ncbi:MAG: Uma2 family endonuclease [Planctomycetota bacterium]
MRVNDEIDLSVDPPPKLVIEVRITSSANRKMELFAKLGVRAVWRYDGDQLSLFCLSGGVYRSIDASLVLPGFPVDQAQAVVAGRNTFGEVALIKIFRASIQQNCWHRQLTRWVYPAVPDDGMMSAQINLETSE